MVSSRVLLVGVVSLGAILSLPLHAAAQDTRTDIIARKQAEKAATAAPYEPTRYEAIMGRLEESFTNPPNGLYPEFGSIYQGGGFSAGVGYRRFFGPEAVWNVRGLFSHKNYKRFEAGVRTPWQAGGRLVLEARAGWLDAPQVGYYGLGMNATRADRTNFRLTQTYASGTAQFKPTRWTRLEGEVGYEDYTTEAGRGSRPSIETRYDALTAPGLFQDMAFVRSEARAAIDYRTAPGYSRHGGSYEIGLVSYADRDGTHGFERLDGELIQHLPILRENWVISLRARVQTTLDDEDDIPYFLLPQLGGGRTLRGYHSGQFRGRHSILTSGEFRWIPNRMALDLALFFDAGKVTDRRSDLDFDGLKTDWGIGARFHGPSSTVLRIEGARGSDAWRLVVSTSAAF
jgi:outer membrane translocation and assembly module TamA